MLKQKLETVREILLQQILLPKLRNNNEVGRFNDIKNEYFDLCEKFKSLGKSSQPQDNSEYEWNTWVESIAGAFQNGVPISFLSNTLLMETMVHYRKGGRKATFQRITNIQNVFNEAVSNRLLGESYIGLPMITDSYWLTSANTAHHAFHLANYKKSMGKLFWDSDNIVEWGGGYGNIARILRKMNPLLTYTILDLPELLALQYIYLYATEGKDAVNIMQPGEFPAQGKVNFLPSTILLDGQQKLKCSGFISTWALTESPYEAQKFITDSNFLNAENVLLGYAMDSNNKIRSNLKALELGEEPVPFLPEGHAYAFR